MKLPNLVKYVPDLRLLLLILLDPYSPLVPLDVREGWSTTTDEVYKLSRDYFYDIHNKCEKLIEASKECIYVNVFEEILEPIGVDASSILKSLESWFWIRFKLLNRCCFCCFRLVFRRFIVS